LKSGFPLLLLLFLSAFLNCQKKATAPPVPVVTYLPLSTGNWWEYVCCDSLQTDSLFVRLEIGDTVTLFGHKGFLYDSDFLPYPYDFIHVKSDTVILALSSDHNQRRILLVDRAGVGTDWELYSVLFQYEVRAHQEERLLEVELENGKKFSDCIKVSTRAHFLSGGSEELGAYFFAPDIGIVKLVLRNFLKDDPLPFQLHRNDLR